MSNEIKYTDYCTCFTDTTNGTITVCFWDEIKDKFIKQVKCSSMEEGTKLKGDWVKNAPSNIICQVIDGEEQ